MYDNEIVITIRTLFFVIGGYQIVTLAYSRIYLKLLCYENDGRKIIYENYRLIFHHYAQQNGKKLKIDLYKYRSTSE